MILANKKMPGREGPGKFEGNTQCRMYQRHGVGARLLKQTPTSGARRSRETETE